MESLYLLIPIALIIFVLAIKLLFWAINSGQYDDLNTEGHRILFDEPVEKRKPLAEQSTTEKQTLEVVQSKESSTIQSKNDQPANNKPANNKEVP